MARQIEPRFGEPRLATLDGRLSDLEFRLASLVEAVQVLTRALESSAALPPAEPALAQAARRARELLQLPRRRTTW